MYWDTINEHRSKKVEATKSNEIAAAALNNSFINVAGGVKSKLPEKD